MWPVCEVRMTVMRADRLVAILLLLQAKGQVTAAEVAAELEVSERTARRDLEALGMAGLPIYSRQGRNGGWQLIGGGRTDLSGLTAAEARALFLVAGPSSSATPEVKAALRKLARALPETFRPDAEAASTAMIIDPVGWDNVAAPRKEPTHLDAVQRAVIEGQQLVLGYVARDQASSTRVVHPLGLATKGTAWYLVADTDAGLRTFRVDRMTSVEPTGERVVRPAGFDLAEAWKLITDEVDQRRAPLRANALGERRSRVGSATHVRHSGAHRADNARRPRRSRAAGAEPVAARRGDRRLRILGRGARPDRGPRAARPPRVRARHHLRHQQRQPYDQRMTPEEHFRAAGAAFQADDLIECRRQAEAAFRGFRDRGDLCAAGRVAISLAELHDNALGNAAAGRGWLDRARRALEQVGPCVEWGYYELAYMACDRPDVDELEASADRALAIALEFHDHNLEVRALADGGLALVTQGRVREGFDRLDSAMAAISAGEVDDFNIAGKCFCSMLSGCERVGRCQSRRRVGPRGARDGDGRRPEARRRRCSPPTASSRTAQCSRPRADSTRPRRS